MAWLRVSPKYVTVRVVGWALGNLVAVAVLSLPLVLVLTGAWAWPPLWLAVAVPAAAFLLALWRLVLIPRQVRSIGYAEREDDLLIRRGIFFQRTLVVPYGRMQYVDIGAGPVERGLGCAPSSSTPPRRGPARRSPACPPGKGRGCANSSPPAARPGWPDCDRQRGRWQRVHRRRPLSGAGWRWPHCSSSLAATPSKRLLQGAPVFDERLAGRAPWLLLGGGTVLLLTVLALS